MSLTLRHSMNKVSGPRSLTFIMKPRPDIPTTLPHSERKSETEDVQLKPVLLTPGVNLVP